MSAAPQRIVFRGAAPSVDESAWIAPSATVIGAAIIGAVSYTHLTLPTKA